MTEGEAGKDEGSVTLKESVLYLLAVGSDVVEPQLVWFVEDREV